MRTFLVVWSRRTAGAGARVNGFALLWVFTSSALLAAEEAAPDSRSGDLPNENERRVFGPLPVRTMDSLALLFYQAPADRAATLGRGRWRFSTRLHYSSLFTGGMGEFQVSRDHEWLRAEIGARFGLTESLDVDVLLPLHHTNSGFLDGFINDVHRATDLGPSDRPEGSYDDLLAFRGQTLLEYPEDGVRLADVPVSVKYAWLRDGLDPLGVSFRAAVELPAGDRSRSAGSGTVDGGIGVLVEKTWGDLSFFGTLDGAFQDTPRRFRRAGVTVEPAIASASLAAEWRVAEWFALVGQIDFAEALIRGADVPQLDRLRLAWSVGAYIGILESTTVDVAIVEDFISASSPDVVFLFGVSVNN